MFLIHYEKHEKFFDTSLHLHIDWCWWVTASDKGVQVAHQGETTHLTWIETTHWDEIWIQPDSDWDLNTQAVSWTHCLLIEITYLVKELNEAGVLYVSEQKEFSERQSDR